MKPQRLARRQSAGFTLIESAMIMMVIVILSLFVFININSSLRANRVNSAATKLAADLRYAQTLATGVGAWYGVSLEVDPLNQYSVLNNASIIENPGNLGTGFIVNVKNDYDVTLAGVNIGGGNKIYFNVFGAPFLTQNGTSLAAEGVITLTKDGATKTVRIAPGSGRIHIQ